MGRDYKQKIIFHTSRLHETLNACPSDYNNKNVRKSLESLNYFVNKQLEINDLVVSDIEYEESAHRAFYSHNL
tara:strand:- start:349 stop:567 length:219 start_codon:yes stop_codon:yes gene_type:complete